VYSPASPSTRPRRAGRWWAAAAVALLLGYTDLWRGGITVGPACLVLGYCVLVPLAIWRR
jgi:hypothetical protein